MAWNSPHNDVEYGGDDGLKKCSGIETGIKPIMVKDSGGSKKTMAWNSLHNDVEFPTAWNIVTRTKLFTSSRSCSSD